MKCSPGKKVISSETNNTEI